MPIEKQKPLTQVTVNFSLKGSSLNQFRTGMSSVDRYLQDVLNGADIVTGHVSSLGEGSISSNVYGGPAYVGSGNYAKMLESLLGVVREKEAAAEKASKKPSNEDDLPRTQDAEGLFLRYGNTNKLELK